MMSQPVAKGVNKSQLNENIIKGDLTRGVNYKGEFFKMKLMLLSLLTNM